MEVYCGHCSDIVPESMGSVKAGDLGEFYRGVRPSHEIRVLCGKCATFYANMKPCWRWLVRFAWFKHPIPIWRIFKVLGIHVLDPAA